MWEERYAGEEYVYGTEPNDFVRASVAGLSPGDALCLAEGEGRNAVYLAGLGHRVTAVDYTRSGMAKARALARTRGVEIETVTADLAEYPLGERCWDLVVATYAHLWPDLRARVHRAVVTALRPGGLFVLEAYTPAQLQYTTGGPSRADLMMTLAELQQELAGLHFEHALECEREVREGPRHSGLAAVVQVRARS